MLFIDKKLTALVKILKEDPSTEEREEQRKKAIEMFSKSITNSVRGGELVEYADKYDLEIVFKLKSE